MFGIADDTAPGPVLDAMDAAGAPLLGHLVLYSIFEGEVTLNQMAQWFRELSLDASFMPAPIGAVDAFER